MNRFYHSQSHRKKKAPKCVYWRWCEKRVVWNQIHLAWFPTSWVMSATALDKDGFSPFMSSRSQVVRSWPCPQKKKKKTTLEVCCFGSSCLWALWSNPAEGHQTHREPSSACSLLPWAPEGCWVNGDGCQPWWKTPRCPGLMALGTILLMESCQLCHLHAGDFLWKWNKTARGSPDAQDLILLMSLTSLMNQEVSRSKYWIKILSIWLTYCRGFSNLGPMPFGITDNAVVLQRSRLPVKCWLISWLVGWLDVRFRCGLYLSISSS